jgi:SNF2 family DNA or RNA helicase
MQSEDRAHRIGQTSKVTYVDLIAEGTVDEKIVKALNDKIDLASQVMGEDPRKILF